MAGNVTGNLGNENITLRNIATEDTLAELVEVMRSQKGGNTKEQKENSQSINVNTAAVKKGTASWGKFFDTLTAGPIRIIRNLDSEINNASYSFSTLARDNTLFSKTLTFAANSVSQMQEQFNSYSKMMQVGGVMAGDFESLRTNAAALGTDLTGLSRLTGEYAQSLKIGSSSTALGLKKLTEAFKVVTGDTEMLRDFGRLGVLPQQISEQLLLAAEAQGGFGDVMKRYNGDAAKFGQGMLKSTRELTIFSTAIGANSQIMQQEAAKASKRASDAIFKSSLSAGEQMTVQYLQTLTGSGELALDVMRSIKTGITSQEAGLFLSSKGIASMGNEIDNFMQMVSKGSDPLEALTKSGLMAFAKNMSKEELLQLSTQEFAYRKQGNTQLADMLNNQLSMIRSLRDSDPEQIRAQVDKLKSSLDPDNTGTTDMFVTLQDQQVRLAQSTAGLSTEFNRLGLMLAGTTMTTLNRGIYELGKGAEGMKQYAKEIFGLDVPDKILKSGVDGIAKYIDKELKKLKAPTETPSTTTGPQIPVNGAPISATANKIEVKMPNGSSRAFDLNELLGSRQLQAQTEAFKGSNNRIGTMVTGSLLQQRVPTLGAITAGDDMHPAHSGTGKHPRGLALDFRVKDVPGRNAEDVYNETIAAMEQVLIKDLGLKKSDYYIENERLKGTGPHIHFQFQDEKVADKVREFYQNQLKVAQETPKKDVAATAQPTGNTTAGTQTSGAPLTGTVNNNVKVTLDKPDWFDSVVNSANEETRQIYKDMGNKFDKMYDMLKRTTAR